MMCMKALVGAQMRMSMCISRVVIVAFMDGAFERRLDSIELSLQCGYRGF